MFKIEILLLILGGILAYALAGISLKQVKESHIKQKRLIADISHELKNPLSALKMTLEVSQKQKD